MNDREDAPRAFKLIRDKDLSGVSGEGHVADGWFWPRDNIALISWRGEWPSFNIHTRGMESVEAVHGHDGATWVEWTEAEVPPEITVFRAAMSSYRLAATASSFRAGRLRAEVYG